MRTGAQRVFSASHVTRAVLSNVPRAAVTVISGFVSALRGISGFRVTCRVRKTRLDGIVRKRVTVIGNTRLDVLQR